MSESQRMYKGTVRILFQNEYIWMSGKRIARLSKPMMAHTINHLEKTK